MATERKWDSVGTTSSPLVAKRNGPRKKLPPEVRVALLAAFYQERPPARSLVTWCRAKADEFQVPAEDVSGLVGLMTEFLEREVQILLGNEAENFAAAAGLTLTRTLRRLNRLLGAKRPFTVSQGKDVPAKVRWCNDGQVQVRAVETALTYFGRLERKQAIQVEHQHQHVIMNLSDEEIVAEIRKLHEKTRAMLEQAPESRGEAPPAVIEAQAVAQNGRNGVHA